jgi:hypothetical protein
MLLDQPLRGRNLVRSTVFASFVSRPESSGDGVRPESWDVVSAQAPGSLSVHVELVEELGFESFAYATPANQDGWSLRAQRIVFRTDRCTR